MADFTVPMIGTEIKPVPQTSLADMLGIARGAQAYQQAQQINPLALQQQQQATRTGQIALSVEEQKDLERKNLQYLIGKEPQKLMTDGVYDPPKAISEILKIAPLTGMAQLKDIAGSFGAQEIFKTGAAGSEAANLALAQKKSQVISNGYVGAINDPIILQATNNPDSVDKNKLVNFLKTWGRNQAKASGVPEDQADKVMQPYFDIAQTNPAAVRSYLIQRHINGLDQSAQLGTYQTTTSVTPEGGAVTVTPGIGTQTVEAGVVKGTDPYLYKDTGKKDPISNQPIYEVRDKLSNQLIGQMIRAPQPEKQPAGFSQAPTIPSGESEETGKKYQDEIITARNSVQPAKTAINGIDTILKYLPLAQTGRASESIAGLESILGNLTGNTASEKAASARDIIQKNIADLGLQKNLALGGKFAASLESAERSLADAGKNPTAIISSMQQLRPLMQHASNYSTGLDKAIDQSPVKQYVKPRFDSAMNDAFDPLALQMKNAADAGKDSFTKFVKDNNLSIVKQQNLLSKLEAYGALVRGDLNAYQKIISGEK